MLCKVAAAAAAVSHTHPLTGLACCSAVGIEMAMKDNVDWLLHIDTDELMYPGGNAGFSLQNVLSTFADEVDTVVFPNYESLPETDQVHDPFTEVILQSSLFARLLA